MTETYDIHPTEQADEATYLAFIKNDDEKGSVAYLQDFFAGDDEALKAFVDKCLVIAQAEGAASEAPAEEASTPDA